MGKLRDQMMRDMELRNLSPRTRQSYLSWMVRYVSHYGQSPEQLGPEEIKAFLHYLVNKKKLSASAINQAYSALKFFYETTLGRPWQGTKIPRSKLPKNLPVILSRGEVQAILSKVRNLKHLCILTTIYSGGLRICEATDLKISDVDSERMNLRVRGKGNKVRYTLLGRRTLDLLRTYWRIHRPTDWLFPSRDPGTPLSECTVQKVFRRAVSEAAITKQVSVHTLRHCFATHLLEGGCDLYYIQRLLGHRSVGTTSIYLHVTRSHLKKITSPVDQLPGWGAAAP